MSNAILNVLTTAITSLAALIIVWCGVCETINAMSYKTGHIVRLAWIALVLGAASALGELWLLQRTVNTSTALFALGMAGLLVNERLQGNRTI